ncbi:MAG: adenylate/guanylate cyclase domain-containing protein [Bacteroidales bacterium]|nr:adenylate/guanylate cyclase domain-containing protein [Bacteroidales bacterium]
MKNSLPPVYFNLRILALAVFLYLMLVFPVSLIMLFKYGPMWMEEKGLLKEENRTDTIQQADKTVINFSFNSNNDSINQANNSEPQKNIVVGDEEIKFGSAVTFLFRLLLISFIVSLLVNSPFKRYFNRKRKLKPISQSLLRFCQRWLIYMPAINSFIIGIVLFIYLIYLAGFMLDEHSSGTSTQFYRQFFFISFFASLLTVLFVYFWHRHRVTFKYIDHIFDGVSLYREGKKEGGRNIKHRLWINSAMTTLMPLIIVVFYLFLSTTGIRQAIQGNPGIAHTQVLFGKYLPYIDNSDLINSDQLFYVNAIDSLLMFVGIFTGILISIIYLFFFVSWTTQSIIVPVSEVLHKMKQPGEDGLGRLAMVRTTDEFGKLAIGYNDMASRISQIITELKQLTEANQRFVPVEFLKFLGKDSIKDVQLGDQVLRCMTVLFADIRSFTTISETMSPKENFNFLNTYLGYMEPIIRKHGGFIDKFIGDSIMALFDEEPGSAIDAALEMHERLKDFNALMEQFGRKPISIGAGIHTGSLMLGVVGGEGRMETTVISDAVNLASRIEGLTRDYQACVIVSETSLNKLHNKDKYFYKLLDSLQVKGRQEVVSIYEIIGKKPT